MGFFDDLFNISDAKEEVARSGKKQRASLDEGFKDIEGYFDPYRTGGNAAYGKMLSLNGIGAPMDATAWLRSTPGYQATLEEGLGVLDRGSIGRAGGNTLRDLSKYAMGHADRTYADAYGRLGGVAQTGYDATGRVAGARQDRATGVAGVHRWQGENMANAELAGGSNLMSLIGMGAQLAGIGMGRGGFGVPQNSTPSPNFSTRYQSPYHDPRRMGSIY